MFRGTRGSLSKRSCTKLAKKHFNVQSLRLYREGEILMGKLDGKVSITTVGAGGIGKEAAITFLKEGAKVVLVDLFEESLNKVKDELYSYGELVTVQADVSKEEDVKNYVQNAVVHNSPIAVLF